jgi:hypothetical protein
MIHSIRLGVTLAIIWGINMFLLSFISRTNYGGVIFRAMENAYPGCGNKSIEGQLLCLVMGTLDGFCLGLIIGLIYNALKAIKY